VPQIHLAADLPNSSLEMISRISLRNSIGNESIKDESYSNFNRRELKQV